MSPFRRSRTVLNFTVDAPAELTGESEAQEYLKKFFASPPVIVRILTIEYEYPDDHLGGQPYESPVVCKIVGEAWRETK